MDREQPRALRAPLDGSDPSSLRVPCRVRDTSDESSTVTQDGVEAEEGADMRERAATRDSNVLCERVVQVE